MIFLKSLFGLLVLIAQFCAFGQPIAKPAGRVLPYPFLKASIGASGGVTAGVSLHSYFRKSLTVGVDYTNAHFEAVNLPRDYGTARSPKDNIKSMAFLIGTNAHEKNSKVAL